MKVFKTGFFKTYFKDSKEKWHYLTSQNKHITINTIVRLSNFD